jgi:solute carrier family 25 (peroxisomal adenine nucleotide transporter), member 17
MIFLFYKKRGASLALTSKVSQGEREMALILTLAAVAFVRRRRMNAAAALGAKGAEAGAEEAKDLIKTIASSSSSPSPAVHAVAGALGGVISFAATYPLATVATRLQTQEKQTKSRREDQEEDDDDAEKGLSRNKDNENSIDGLEEVEVIGMRPYKGMLDCLARIWREEGPASLYGGLSTCVFGVALTQFVFYFAYAAIRAHFVTLVLARRKARAGAAPGAERDVQLGTAANLLLSSLAGVVTAVTTNPVWVVNTRLQNARRAASGLASSVSGQSPASLSETPGRPGKDDMAQSVTERQHEQALRAAEEDGLHDGSAKNMPAAPVGVLHTTLSLLKDEGVKGFFRGIIPALILVSNPAIQYTVFERLKEAFVAARRKRGNESDLGSLHHFALGVLAKAVATVMTYPYIVTKTVQQTQGKTAQSGGGPEPTMAILVRIAATEGPFGLFRGLRSKILQSTLTAGILFLTKEEITNAIMRLSI